MEMKTEQILAGYQQKVMELMHEVILLKEYIRTLETSKTSK
ncbi:hypothetical protein [Priestia megaterium]|nr:hypothetical protein [Priestia megaterium]MDR7207607.1 hypothetical protein [Priestia megaterium]